MNSSDPSTKNGIIGGFDANAGRYDSHTPVQRIVAQKLIAWSRAATALLEPQRILDIGCGTGYVTETIAAQWQAAKILALEPAAGMRDELRKKMPRIEIVDGTAGNTGLAPASFDLIFSSMALHWEQDVKGALLHGRSLLKPGGRYFAAFMVKGSFREWNELCARKAVPSGVWNFPSGCSVAPLANRCRKEEIVHEYETAHHFMRALKMIGGKSPRPDYTPVKPAVLRELLQTAPEPFPVTYKVVLLDMKALTPGG
jgi:malonyl-CoA O-methyltransferase